MFFKFKIILLLVYFRHKDEGARCKLVFEFLKIFNFSKLHSKVSNRMHFFNWKDSSWFDRIQIRVRIFKSRISVGDSATKIHLTQNFFIKNAIRSRNYFHEISFFYIIGFANTVLVKNFDSKEISTSLIKILNYFNLYFFK